MSQSPADVYKEWRAAVEAAAAIRRSIIGRRVVFGKERLPGVVVDMSASGCKVRFDTNVTELLHPDDLTLT